MAHVLRRAWGRVRWKVVAIITFTGTSTILIACLAVVALNVVMRRESANIVESRFRCSFSPAGPLLPQSWTTPAPAWNNLRVPARLSRCWRTRMRPFLKVRPL